MVHGLLRVFEVVREDAAVGSCIDRVVVDELIRSSKRASDRPIFEDFLGHRLGAVNATKAANTEAGEGFQRKAGARGLAIGAQRSALPVASHVGLAPFIRHRRVLHEAENHVRLPSQTARGNTAAVRGAVHHRLAGYHNIGPSGFSCNLDPVVQLRDGAVNPAAPAISGNMLVHVARAVIDAIHVPPIEMPGQRTVTVAMDDGLVGVCEATEP
mmetsp:Transcript_12066/g.33425  ORF Transcript_12066/g.33425 Transcript_12066/m.33425 type:complete len:213 (+) Transcript_12066:2353-2991(+)